jgi:hypothetical protein
MRVCLETSTLRVRHTGIAIYRLELMQALLGQLGLGESLGSGPINLLAPTRGCVALDVSEVQSWPTRLRPF